MKNFCWNQTAHIKLGDMRFLNINVHAKTERLPNTNRVILEKLLYLAYMYF